MEALLESAVAARAPPRPVPVRREQRRGASAVAINCVAGRIAAPHRSAAGARVASSPRRLVARASPRQGSDSMWEVLEAAGVSSGSQRGASTAAVPPPSPPPIGSDPPSAAQTLLDGLTEQPSGMLRGLVAQLKEAVQAIGGAPTAGEAAGPVRLEGAGNAGLGGLADQLSGLLASARDALPALELPGSPDLEALLERADAAVERVGDGSLLEQGVELLLAESAKLGNVEDPELVGRLRNFGVPAPLTKVLAEALDFEFDLADDGAPGVVALLLVAIALVAIFASVRRRSKASTNLPPLQNPPGDEAAGRLPAVYDPEASAAYFERRPALLVSRLAELASKSAAFLLGVAIDRRTGAARVSLSITPGKHHLTSSNATALKACDVLHYYRPHVIPAL
eukprot:jgi/Tetstr1/459352/TSEL_004746.t1